MEYGDKCQHCGAEWYAASENERRADIKTINHRPGCPLRPERGVVVNETEERASR